MSARAWLRILVVMLFAVVLRLGFRSLDSLASAVEPSPAPIPARAAQPLAVGTSSCSARACHGSLVPVGNDTVRRDEYTKWLATDKHAQAYLVLFEKRSQTIAKNLGLEAAHTAEKCLVCHQYPRAPSPVDRDYLSGEKLYGIGCEACHGDARNWLELHTQKRLNVEEKADKGMTAVDEPAQVGQKCVGCHVGSKAVPGFAGARDVNHDLIAAGHPRLNFEFAAFLANLPRHWNEEKKTRTPEAALRAWASGQTITAKAALELLAYRAEQAKSGSARAPWPEFAEYDCFSCHHNLQAESWRQEPAYARRRLGSLAWSSWYYAMPRILAAPAAANVPDLLKSLDGLERLLRMPSPNKDLVITEAQKAIARIDRVLKDPAGVPQDARSLAQAYRVQLQDPKLVAALGNWDGAAQLYLALAALADGKQDPKLHSLIDELYKQLAFGKAKANEKYDSPKDYQPKLLREILEPTRP